MQPFVEFIADQFIDQALPIDPPHTIEPSGDNFDPKMRLPFRTRAGVSGMQLGLVRHHQ